jgi:zinc transporter ZupT
MAIWLGILLDGIPESLMIGSHMTEGHMISMSLVAGLFLSNYPEALSSSASMREQGIPFRQVLLAWVFLMVMTGIGAAIGNIVLDGASASTFALIGGIAGGAMLTVIAETMLPEAYVKGGSVIGFITLIGFLTAIMFKAFDTAM